MHSPSVPFPPTAGSATRRPTAVTAVTSCAAAAATTPTQTAWSSGVTANTTGAATSPAAGVNAPWSATSASEAPPTPWGPAEARPGGPETPRGVLLGISRCQVWEGACALPPLWKPPGTEGPAALEGGPGHQRKPTRLKITWQPEPGSARLLPSRLG